MEQLLTYTGLAKELQADFAGSHHDNRGLLLVVTSGQEQFNEKNSIAAISIPAFVNGFRASESSDDSERLRSGIVEAQQMALPRLKSNPKLGATSITALYISKEGICQGLHLGNCPIDAIIEGESRTFNATHNLYDASFGIGINGGLQRVPGNDSQIGLGIEGSEYMTQFIAPIQLKEGDRILISTPNLKRAIDSSEVHSILQTADKKAILGILKYLANRQKSEIGFAACFLEWSMTVNEKQSAISNEVIGDNRPLPLIQRLKEDQEIKKPIFERSNRIPQPESKEESDVLQRRFDLNVEPIEDMEEEKSSSLYIEEEVELSQIPPKKELGTTARATVTSTDPPSFKLNIVVLWLVVLIATIIIITLMAQ